MNLKKCMCLLCLGMVLMMLVACASEPAKAPEEKTEKISEDSSQEKLEPEPKINYPEKTIQIIVNRAPGGGSDTVARMISSELEGILGESIVILNQDGGDGVIGLNEASKAKGDGYTLTVVAQNEIANILVNGKGLEFTPESFKYVASVNIRGVIFAMKKGSQFNSLDEIIEYAKAHPKEITIGIPGGAVEQVALDLMEALGVEFTIVNAGGGSKLYSALLGGHIDTGIIGAQFYDRFTGEGCNVLAQTVEESADGVAELKTFKELGYDVVFDSRMLLAATKDTPQEIIDVLSDAMDKSFDNLAEKLRQSGETPKYIKGEELNKYLESYYAREIPKLEKTKESKN